MEQNLLADGRRSEKRAYEVVTINARHREMVRLALAGFKYVEIAELVGVAPVNVSQVLNSSIVRKHMETLQQASDDIVTSTVRELTCLQPEIVDLYQKVLSGEEPAELSDRIRISESILDRTKVPKSKNELRQVNVSHLTEDDIRRLKGERETILLEAEATDEI